MTKLHSIPLLKAKKHQCCEICHYTTPNVYSYASGYDRANLYVTWYLCDNCVKDKDLIEAAYITRRL